MFWAMRRIVLYWMLKSDLTVTRNLPVYFLSIDIWPTNTLIFHRSGANMQPLGVNKKHLQLYEQLIVT